MDGLFYNFCFHQNLIEKYLTINQLNLNTKIQQINISTIRIYQKKCPNTMADLIKIKGLKGKQNKKKWVKNVDVTGLLQHVAQQHTDKVREKFVQPLKVEADNDLARLPLDPNRFKSKGTKIPKPKYDNRIKKQSLLNDQIDDPWLQTKQIKSKYKIPKIPAIIKPQTGHSYNPTEEGVNQIIDHIIDYEGEKQKKTKKIKKPQFKQQQIRHRNKNVRAQQLQIRDRKVAKQRLHQLHSYKKLQVLLQNKSQAIEAKLQLKQEKKQKWQEEAKAGKVRYGKKIGKSQYKYRQQLPNLGEAKKLSHVQGSDRLVKQRFDSIYRRGIFEPRNIKVHANRTKKIKSKLRYAQSTVKQNPTFIK